MRDSIEAQVEIAAPLARVWDLVSQPGWWVNDGTITEHAAERQGPEGDEWVVHNGDHGDMVVSVVELVEPHRAVYRWSPAGSDAPLTTVEFTLRETTAGSVTVAVVESGFASLTPEQHEKTHPDNVEGWGIELRALSTTVGGDTT